MLHIGIFAIEYSVYTLRPNTIFAMDARLRRQRKDCVI